MIFIIFMFVVIEFGDVGKLGNNFLFSVYMEIIEFNVVNGSCGMLAFTMSRFVSDYDAFKIFGVVGLNFNLFSVLFFVMVMVILSIMRISVMGM